MGRFSSPLKHLQTLVASSTEFQSVVALPTESAAKAKAIRWTADNSLDQEKIPRAIIGRAGNFKVKRTSTTGWKTSGRMAVLFEFEAPVDKRTDRATAFDWYEETVDLIIDQMRLNSNPGGGYLEVLEFIEVEPADFIEQDDNNGDWVLTSIFVVVT